MNKKTKIVPINELPSASSVEDDDILIKSNFENTEKMTANQLQEYVNKRRKHADWEETDIKSDAYIENKPTSLSADGGNADTVNGHTVESDVPQNAKFTDTVYIHPNSGVTASTYKSVTVDSKGHVTSGTNPSTLNEYGITDAVSKTELENKVNIHNSSDTSHSDIREFIKDLDRRLNALADSDDTTLDQMSEIVTYIKSNKSLIDNITTTKINVADIIDNLTSVSINKPLSAKQGKLLNDLITSLDTYTKTEIDSLKKSVSDGKAKVASAITAKGVTTATDATFDIIAGNITKIKTGIDTSDANATGGQILSGYTAYVKNSKVTGIMPNRGAWVGATEGYGNVAIPSGYHNGSGYVSGTGAYNKGVNDADARPNTNSVNYKTGYNNGVTSADNRANPNSVNYKTGYNAGYAAGQGAINVIRKEVTRQVQCHSGGGEGSPRIELVTFDMDFPHRVVGIENYWVNGQGQKFGLHGFDISGNRITLHLGNTISWFDATITLRVMIVGY